MTVPLSSLFQWLPACIPISVRDGRGYGTGHISMDGWGGEDMATVGISLDSQ